MTKTALDHYKEFISKQYYCSKHDTTMGNDEAMRKHLEREHDVEVGFE